MAAPPETDTADRDSATSTSLSDTQPLSSRRPPERLTEAPAQPLRGSAEPLRGPAQPLADAPAQTIGPAPGQGDALEGEASQAGRTPLWAEVLVLAWLAWVYDAINNLAPFRLRPALAHAESVLHLERTLHLDPELTLNRWLAGHQTLGLLVSYYYDNAHFVVTFGLLGWLWYSRPKVYRSLRNVLVTINVLGMLVFWLYPMAPPRLLAGQGFVDVVAATHAFGSWHTGALSSAANQFAAMPSLHMAWAAWCTLAVWRASRRRWLRTLAVIYPCITFVAVLGTGNHFLADVLAGLATTGIAVVLVRALEAWHRSGGAPWQGLLESVEPSATS
jgi:hypothetical protein